MSPLAARAIYIPSDGGRAANIRLLQQRRLDAGFREDIPIEAMAQLVTGMIRGAELSCTGAVARDFRERAAGLTGLARHRRKRTEPYDPPSF
jgi:hypothetical protein